MILDFKEIPEANRGGGLQDTFELFARDFLHYLGYKIIENPDRGPDGKKDMIIEERIASIASDYNLRWLVSCKHFAHTGASVKDSDEINIAERLKQHKCDGFMGFYSTLCSSGLNSLLNNLTDTTGRRNTYVYDHEMIEGLLLRDRAGMELAARYFPISFKQYIIENPVPVELFSDQEPIYCEHCGKNLLAPHNHGLYCLLKRDLGDDKDGLPIYNPRYEGMYFACCGSDNGCDTILRKQYSEMGLHDSGWYPLDDLCVPTIWFMRLFAFVNGIFHKQDLSPEVYSKIKKMFTRTYPYVARHLTSKEKDRIKDLLQFDLL